MQQKMIVQHQTTQLKGTIRKKNAMTPLKTTIEVSILRIPHGEGNPACKQASRRRREELERAASFHGTLTGKLVPVKRSPSLKLEPELTEPARLVPSLYLS